MKTRAKPGITNLPLSSQFAVWLKDKIHNVCFRCHYCGFIFKFVLKCTMEMCISKCSHLNDNAILIQDSGKQKELGILKDSC